MTDHISTVEAAEVVGCSIHTILKYARKGKIPHTRTPFKQGRGYRFVYSRADIEAFARCWKNGGTQKHRKAPVATHLPGGFVRATHLARHLGIRPEQIYTAARNTDLRTKKQNQRLYVHAASMRALIDGCDPEEANPTDWHCFGYDGSQSLYSGTLDECIEWRDSPEAPEYVRIIRCEQNDLINAMSEDLDAARDCPARGGGQTENELRQDCRECLRENRARAACCDAIEEGEVPELNSLLTVDFTRPQGWEMRVLRRAGLEEVAA